MTDYQQLLAQTFPDLDWRFDVSLAEHSYFKVGGPAEVWLAVKDLTVLRQVLAFCAQQDIPWTIMGGASNVIISDQGIKGLVLSNHCQESQIISNTDQELVIEAESGIKTNVLVMEAVKLRATGLEGFIGVPGQLGGAIYNNAHYLKQLIGDYIETVLAFHVKKNKDILFSREKCEFAYESSIFQQDRNLVILKAKFKLNKDDPQLIKERLVQAQTKRTTSQPLDLPSSGCIFQNPANTDHLKQLFPQFAEAEFIPAGFLIDQAGLKGKQIGQIAVSDKHAAFLVNVAPAGVQAKARDIVSLIQLVKQTVKQQFQVDLQEEVFYLGRKI